MIPTYLSANWRTLAPALGNHLWQSTLCLVVAGLLTLVFRKNHARVRYGLWLAASIKFLIPFSLLIILGNNLAKPRVVYQTETGFMTAMQEASQPFARPVAHVPSPVAFSPATPNLLPAILTTIWLSGFAAVLILWFVRWRRIRSIVRRSVPVREGRELMALRRVEGWAGVRKPIEFVSSQTTLEPGIFGVFTPVLIWPQGISPRLEDAHLEAILAHEVWHVRRHDNLASAIHMLVEAIFCFHPMVWWLASRLVEERERACDEQVLQLGSKPNIYAESILKTCEFCVESPLACVSGVTGADLKKRIVHIMTERVANQLGLGRKLLLAAIGIAVITVPIVFGLMNPTHTQAQATTTTSAPLPSFEVASIKPNRSADDHFWISFDPGRFRVTDATTEQLITLAYNIKDFQVTGGPSWINSEKYDIDAKLEDVVEDRGAKDFEKLPPDRRRKQMDLMLQSLQSLLAERFNMKVNRETKELPIYTLVVAKNGPKLLEANPNDTYPNGIKGPDGIAHPGMMHVGRGELKGQGIPVGSLQRVLSQLLSRTVLDQTGLKGKYDIELNWTPDESEAGMFRGPTGGNPAAANPTPPESIGPSLFTALQEQLGLKLESTKGPVEVLVIDHIERPSEN
jgi:uncharacterized protein (TIGR03435 family)